MSKPIICLALACLLGAGVFTPTAYAADSDPTTAGPDLRAIRAQIEAKQYAPALAQLKVLVVTYNQNPDVLSLLGHALWKTGDPTQGMVYYNKALALNPSHKGALEYQGELYVAQGQLDKANENLARLNHLCWLGCEEASDLKEAIEHAPKPR